MQLDPIEKVIVDEDIFMEWLEEFYKILDKCVKSLGDDNNVFFENVLVENIFEKFEVKFKRIELEEDMRRYMKNFRGIRKAVLYILNGYLRKLYSKSLIKREKVNKDYILLNYENLSKFLLKYHNIFLKDLKIVMFQYLKLLIQFINFVFESFILEDGKNDEKVDEERIKKLENFLELTHKFVDLKNDFGKKFNILVTLSNIFIDEQVLKIANLGFVLILLIFILSLFQLKYLAIMVVYLIVFYAFLLFNTVRIVGKELDLTKYIRHFS